MQRKLTFCWRVEVEWIQKPTIDFLCKLQFLFEIFPYKALQRFTILVTIQIQLRVEVFRVLWFFFFQNDLLIILFCNILRFCDCPTFNLLILHFASMQSLLIIEKTFRLSSLMQRPQKFADAIDPDLCFIQQILKIQRHAIKI